MRYLCTYENETIIEYSDKIGIMNRSYIYAISPQSLEKKPHFGKESL